MILRFASAVVATAALTLGGLATLPAYGAPGNNGTVKISGIDDTSSPSNNPHVGCTFSVEWAKFDDGSVSTVSFAPQAPTADATITVMGPAQVAVGEALVRKDYTLTFDGTPAAQGFHVKLTTHTTGSIGNDTKSKVFWVSPCDDSGSTPVVTPPTCSPLDSGVLNPAAPADALLVHAPEGKVITGYCLIANGVRFETTLASPTAETWIQDAVGGMITEYALSYGTPTGGPSDGPTTPTTPTTPKPSEPPFSWDWEYPAPTCLGLTVRYPSALPSGQSNDVNIRVRFPGLNAGSDVVKTFNFHNNTGTWSGEKTFVYSDHRDWPAGATSYVIEWTQVAGTNFHWGAQKEPGVRCATDGDPETPDLPQTVTSLAPPSSLRTTVGQRNVAASAAVAGGAGVVARSVQLQRLQSGNWVTVTAGSTSAAGSARLTVPTAQAGTATYRIVAPATVRHRSSVSASFTVVSTPVAKAAPKAKTTVKKVTKKAKKKAVKKSKKAKKKAVKKSKKAKKKAAKKSSAKRPTRGR